VTLVALQKVVPSASELLLQEQLVGISGGG